MRNGISPKPVMWVVLMVIAGAGVAWAQGTSAPSGGTSPMALIMRWLHVLPAIMAVGGAIFMRFVLMPAAAGALDDEAHGKLRAAVIKRWRMIVHLSILLFLISGFYNYLAVTRHQHPDNGLYHAMFGVKFILALVVFFFAIALTSSKAWSEGFRSKAATWLGLLVALAVAVVLIAGFMKVMPS